MTSVIIYQFMATFLTRIKISFVNSLSSSKLSKMVAFEKKILFFKFYPLLTSQNKMNFYKKQQIFSSCHTFSAIYKVEFRFTTFKIFLNSDFNNFRLTAQSTLLDYILINELYKFAEYKFSGK